jgi:hypothetical protein
VAVLTTTNTKVSRDQKEIMIGSMERESQKSVYCHQSLYPYRLYYRHSVPYVRVNEAEISDVNDKATINHGLAICPFDASVF